MSNVQPRQPLRQPSIVVDRNGLRGTISPAATATGRSNDMANGKATGDASQVLVDFDNGERLLVPRDLLHEEAEGRYRLLLSVEELHQAQANLSDSESLVIPMLEEHVEIGRATTTNRVQITKSVHERVEVVDEPVFSEEVEIERVVINQPLAPTDAAAQVHREGDILIIPLLEEVLVVEKRLILKEEVRIRKIQRDTFSPQEVTLRSEQINVTRTPGTDGERHP
jgi:uncharacterized protein (TIGR02271 family)